MTPHTFVYSRLRSFRNAFTGLCYVIRTQKNAWIHGIATVLAIFLALWLKLNAQDWALLFLAIGFVWAAEFFNTSLEAVVDLASPQNHPLAKVGKDVGAAAVLISAIVALLVGIFIFGPPLSIKIQLLIHQFL